MGTFLLYSIAKLLAILSFLVPCYFLAYFVPTSLLAFCILGFLHHCFISRIHSCLVPCYFTSILSTYVFANILAFFLAYFRATSFHISCILDCLVRCYISFILSCLVPCYLSCILSFLFTCYFTCILSWRFPYSFSSIHSCHYPYCIFNILSWLVPCIYSNLLFDYLLGAFYVHFGRFCFFFLQGFWTTSYLPFFDTFLFIP